MTLRELVKYFRSGGSYEEFCQSKSLSLESEVIEIYMQKPFHLNNDLAFFELENTEGKLEYIFNSTKYFNLFDFFYFLDAIAESNNSENTTFNDEEILNKLFLYAINDA